MHEKAIQELLTKMADDALIIGHRNSEWTGLGPIIEEDIAFASMAQDKIGHALALYRILHEQFQYPEPDDFAFNRKVEDMRCCHLVELPIGEYDFSLIRHFLFDHAEFCRYRLLENSTFEPLARLAKKIKGELKYHILHADIWLKNLGRGSEESHARMQNALDYAFPFALGIFEESPYEQELMDMGVFSGENQLKKEWLEQIVLVIENAGLTMPDTEEVTPGTGGRRGVHTEYLQPLLDEMTEVRRQIPDAEW